MNLAQFLLQLALHDPSLVIVRPSKLAAASILVVKKLRDIEAMALWSDELFRTSGYQQEELEEIANKLYILLV